MDLTIGIRRENKNDWERRVPLMPAALADLRDKLSLNVLIQPSSIRAVEDSEFEEAGLTVQEDLSPASIVFAIKEIPPQHLEPNRVYVFFSHVIKGQPYNMPMLKRLMDLNCTLVDYEKIEDDKGRRLIFFGVHAGYAGMIETLWCLGQRLQSKGIDTPLADIKHAFEYGGLPDAKDHLREIGKLIKGGGLPVELRPLVIGISGYGNVSKGAQEILDSLPFKEISASELPGAAVRGWPDSPPILKVVFKEEDMVRPAADGVTFELQDYYRHPELYEGRFEDYLPYLDVLVNAAYWDERYPRLVTKDWARKHYHPDKETRLQVIGDISCDIDGGIELTSKTTMPDDPCYVYDPQTDSAVSGCEGIGPAIMAVDNLPCELPRESSEYFSDTLKTMVGSLTKADWTADFAELDLPDHLKWAVIVHKGELTPPYRYLKEHLAS